MARVPNESVHFSKQHCRAFCTSSKKTLALRTPGQPHGTSPVVFVAGKI
jgi:hypothetical protein